MNTRSLFSSIALAVTFAAGLAHPDLAAAQGLGLGAKSGKPIEVFADKGIEWLKADRRYIARGNAKAIQGTTTVYGDTLIAYYSETKGKDSEIYRIDAIGNVKITSPTETAYGETGVYDIINGVLVLKGNNLKLLTREDIITARDSLEYYETKNLAIARGQAKARPTKKLNAADNRLVKADVLTALFTNAPKKTAKKLPRKKTSKQDPNTGTIRRIDAYGNVVIIRPGEIALGDRGTYFPQTGVANLWGKVKITRGDSQMNGDRAIVNMKTGISHIISDNKSKGTPPVRMLLAPKKNADPKEKQSKSRAK